MSKIKELEFVTSFTIQEKRWEKLRDKILEINFESATPRLLDFGQHTNYRRITFISNVSSDVYKIMDILSKDIIAKRVTRL